MVLLIRLLPVTSLVGVLFLVRFGVLGAEKDLCSSIKFMDRSRKTPQRSGMLKEICSAGTSHVDLDDVRKQFAIFALVRDSFATSVTWHSGDAKNVINDPFWVVNDVVRLNSTKYQWYKYGFPMWPLPFQAMSTYNPPVKETKPKILTAFKKEENWPNYGLATPVYFSSNAWRNQMWNLEEFIQEELQAFKKHKASRREPPSSLTDPLKFKTIGKELLEGVNPARVESYSSWPFLTYSLIPMVKTSVKRNKGLCPDDLLIYFRYNSCHPLEEPEVTCSSASSSALTLLTHAKCRSTNVVIGYSLERNETPM